MYIILYIHSTVVASWCRVLMGNEWTELRHISPAFFHFRSRYGRYPSRKKKNEKLETTIDNDGKNKKKKEIKKKKKKKKSSIYTGNTQLGYLPIHIYSTYLPNQLGVVLFCFACEQLQSTDQINTGTPAIISTAQVTGPALPCLACSGLGEHGKQTGNK